MCAMRMAQNGNDVTIENHGTGGDWRNGRVMLIGSRNWFVIVTLRTHRGAGVAPQGAQDVLLLVLGYARVALRVLVDHE